ncbi:MAG: DNA polymerase III subunit gamma/tau [Saprospiraceae bacterium]|nr:DNA polymerase III subunit gamma/tau [Saprospiraceae bacterium]
MSNFVVSARKYRPNRFEDVVGQEHVSRTLKNALQSGQLAHAFLFCGPRGVGKTTCARILAKVLNCQNLTKDFEPCNECSSCKSFNENASFNITELDAASNNSVEHIRALIEQVRFQPQQGRYKVFIIDEVHMLSQQAFNAFLKTLEEPPPYAIFILATTEKHKIIPTILSRCQIYDFRRIQVQDMVAHLQHICKTESIDAEEDALHIIAQKADGALRDALSIFDRIVAFSGKKIIYQDVISNLNVLDYDYYFRMVDALLVEDISKVLLIFDDILRKGFDPELFINGFAEHLRNLLVCKDEQTLQLLEISDTLQARYFEQSQITPSAFILTALNISNDCDIEYKNARNKRLHVEMALIKMTYVNRAIQIARQPELVGEEKKKPDGELEIGNRKSEVGSPRSEAGQQLPATSDQPPIVSDQESITYSYHEPPSNEATPSLFAKAKNSDKHSMPKLSGGLNALLEEVKGEENNNGKEDAPELTLEELTIAWQQYVDNSEQPDAVKILLQDAALHLEQKHIIAIANSSLAENAIREESGLIEYIRRYFDETELMFSVKKSEKKQTASPPKPLTVKEKYLKMRETNPLLQELQSRFDLRPDED